MSVDLVKVLRAMADADDPVTMVAEDPSVVVWCREAADEIDRLMLERRAMADGFVCVAGTSEDREYLKAWVIELSTALHLLLSYYRPVEVEEPPERRIPARESVRASDLRQARRALSGEGGSR